jgi:peptidoglycan/LPS O-acetylase OafA/YrhL
MLGGLFVHGSMLLEARQLFEGISTLSGTFRMGVFFAISGFLTSRTMMTRPLSDWIKRRAVQLIPPTLFAFVVICPSIGAVLALHAGNASVFWPSTIQPHHLWFLLALCSYNAVAVGLAIVGKKMWPGLPSSLTTALGENSLLVVTILCGLLLAGPTFWLLPSVLGDGGTWSWCARCVMLHAPTFFMGLVLGLSGKGVAPRSSVLRFSLATLVVGLLLILAIHTPGSTLLGPDRAYAMAEVVRLTLTPPAAALIVLQLVGRIRTVSPALLALSEASLAIYLLHFPVQLATQALLSTSGADAYFRYGVAVVVGGLVPFVLHRLLANRSETLSLIIAGRRRRRPEIRDSGAHRRGEKVLINSTDFSQSAS